MCYLYRGAYVRAQKNSVGTKVGTLGAEHFLREDSTFPTAEGTHSKRNISPEFRPPVGRELGYEKCPKIGRRKTENVLQNPL